MIRRPRSGLAGQPVLVGVLALLVVLAGVYVSYTATKGLPFVPKYRINVQVPNAAQLFKDSNVTVAGDRVGQVLNINAGKDANGTPIAVLDVAIDKQYEPLPVDTTALIRPAGTLGAKFLQLTPGTSTRMIPDGGTLPADQATKPVVDIDQVLDTFSAPVRLGAATSLENFGLGLAGRGEGINAAIPEFVPLVSDLEPVMRGLAAPSTHFGRLWRSFESLAAELAPVADQTAAGFRDLNTTFKALAGVAPDIRETITEQPPTFDAAVAAFRHTTPLLHQTAKLFDALRPGAEVLPRTAPVLADAFEAGARTLPDVPALSGRLVNATGALARFSENSDVESGLQRLTLTADSLSDPIAFLKPVQTTCNYMALFMRNVGSLFKEHVSGGTTVRVSGVVTGVDTNSERGPADAIYKGKPSKALGPLHSDPYPNTASPGQPHECEAGNEPYIQNKPVVGNVPGLQKASTEEASLP